MFAEWCGSLTSHLAASSWSCVVTSCSSPLCPRTKTLASASRSGSRSTCHPCQKRGREKWPTLPGLKVDFVGMIFKRQSLPWLQFKSIQSHSSCRDLNLQPLDYESGTLTTELSPVPKVKHSQICSRAHDTCDFMFKKESGWLNQKSTISFTRWVSWWVRSLKECKWGQGKMFFIKILGEDLGQVIISSG